MEFGIRNFPHPPQVALPVGGRIIEIELWRKS